jgi:putative ABC transport system permease protein
MRWVRRLFRKEAVERQLDAELRFHIEQQTSDYIAEGMNPTEARRRAQAEFGGVERVKEGSVSLPMPRIKACKTL